MEIMSFLENECFCLKYELNALAEVTLRNESERWIPGYINHITEDSHIKRYQLASQYSKGKVLLDLACGVGKGSYMLATTGEAKLVKGCDIQEEAIRYAKHRNGSENLVFEIQNAENYFNTGFYDLIVSYETIEHLKNYKQFISNVKESLKTKGVFIVSTPLSAKAFDNNPGNPYHVQEWGFYEFQNLLSNYFKIKKVFVQLYQNSFLKEEYQSKNLKESSKGRQIKNIIKKIIGTNKNELGYFDDWKSRDNYTKITEFTGQFDVNKFGTQYYGYQIVICEKN